MGIDESRDIVNDIDKSWDIVNNIDESSDIISRPDFSDFFHWASRARSSQFDRARAENHEPGKNALPSFTIMLVSTWKTKRR